MKDELKVGFLSHFSQYWLGGVNYFKNLFIAMETVESPKLTPYILPPADDSCSCFPASVKRFDRPEIPPQGDNFARAADYEVDILSHLQECIGEDGIAWIADFQHLHLPEMFDQKEINYRNEGFSTLIKKNRLVVLSSQAAIEDFVKFAPEYAYKARKLHFTAIPDPAVYDISDEEAEELRKKLNLPEKFFYVPNQFWKHKNHIVVFKAIAMLKKKGIDIHVAFSGNTFDVRFPDYFNELMNFCKENGIEDNVHILGLIPLREVFYLMRYCIAMINPSKFEGWSSSVEEAKSIGKTIILSALPVHYEQNPPGGIFFPVEDPVFLSGVLSRCWSTMQPGPDAELERAAKEALPLRIKEFGLQFRDIVMEALNGAPAAAADKKKEKPQVSVITAVFNLIKNGRKELLIRCLDSVKKQEGVTYEHLIVDGGSKDGTVEFLRELQKQYSFKFISEPDHGIYDAMNKGTIWAEGKYVSYLNSDDCFDSGSFLKESVRELDFRSGDLSYSITTLVDEAGNNIPHPHNNPSLDNALLEMPFCHQSCLFLRKSVLEFGLYDLRYKSASDYDLILRMLLAGKRCIKVPVKGAIFTVGGFSQENMERAQREVGMIYSNLYSQAGIFMTPEEGYELYIKKVPPQQLAELQDITPIDPVITVILPTRNSIKYLDERIESIRQQTFKKFEVLVIDTDSTDGTLEKIKEWMSEDKRVCIMQTPPGLYHAWNYGIRKARGEYIYIATSDDTMTPCCLEKMYNALKKHPDCDICDSRLELIDENSKILSSSDPEYFSYQGHFTFPIDKVHIRRAPHDFLNYTCGKTVYTSFTQIMFRKQLVDKVGFFPENFGPSADYMWGMKAGLHADVIYIPEVLSHWRQHAEQMTGHDKNYENFLLMKEMNRTVLKELPVSEIQSKAAELSRLIELKEILLPAKRFPSAKNFVSAAIHALMKKPRLSLRFFWCVLTGGSERFRFVRAYDRLFLSLLKDCNMEQYIEILSDDGEKICKYDKTPVRVGFCAQQSSSWNGGINYYRNLFIAIRSLQGTPELIPCIFPVEKDAEVLTKYAEIIDRPKETVYCRLRGLWAKSTGRTFDSTQRLWKQLDVDLLSHGTVITGKPMIAWIPDFQHIHLPEMFTEHDLNCRNIGYHHVVAKSDLVILSSEDAMNDFNTLYPDYKDKARCLHFVAIPDADLYETCDKNYDTVKQKYDLPERYFYIPNQFWKHKNHITVFRALAKLIASGKKINIVCSGYHEENAEDHFYEDLLNFCNENGLSDYIKFLGVIPYQDVQIIFRNSVGIINPSKFEGWSTSVEEAKSIGKRIILSDLPVHREQNPPEGVFFPPEDVDTLAAVLSEKWEEWQAGPHYDLEERAKAELQNRITEFGENYRKIVMELLENKAKKRCIGRSF